MNVMDIVFWDSGLPSDQDRRRFQQELHYLSERLTARIKAYRALDDIASESEDLEPYLASLEAQQKVLAAWVNEIQEYVNHIRAHKYARDSEADPAADISSPFKVEPPSL